jgi:hypothetical protein
MVDDVAQFTGESEEERECCWLSDFGPSRSLLAASRSFRALGYHGEESEGDVV